MPNKPKLFSLIKTDCGRAKYSELIVRKGLTARIRFIWFILVAVIKDWNIKEDTKNF